MIISKVIRQHGYTIEQVADKLGIKRGSLANTIGGNPTVETLQKIADAIGASRSEFFADEVVAEGKIIVVENKDVEVLRSGFDEIDEIRQRCMEILDSYNSTKEE